MAASNTMLKQFWEDTIKTMPKQEVQAYLKEIGFNLPTASLSEDEVRKVLYGFLAKLDAELQESAIQLIRSKEKK